MTQVFISYSRKDSAFVRSLHEALVNRQHETWVDWEGIPPSDKWMVRIHAAIDASDAFIFVISPDSITSQVCDKELAYAVKHHKRLIPVLRSEPDTGVPPSLAEINYILARRSDHFRSAVDTLVEAIDTDLDWVRSHTRLLVRALEWASAGREPGSTLRGRELADFEEWLAKAPEKDPKPTILQSKYLLASRRAVTRRQRITWMSIAAGLSIAVALGIIAWFQNQESNRQAQIVEARQLLSQAEGMRDNDQYAGSLRTASKALSAFERLGEPTFDADLSLRKSYVGMEKWTDLDTGFSSYETSAFDANGRFVGLIRKGMEGAEISVWDTQQQARLGGCKIDLLAGHSDQALSVSTDGVRVAVYLYSINMQNKSSLITVWSLPDCKPLLTVTVSVTPSGGDGLRSMSLTPDGAALAVLTHSGLELWNLATKTPLHTSSDARIDMVALAPDSKRIATYEYRKANEAEQIKRSRLVRIRKVGTGEILHMLEITHRPDSFRWTDNNLLAGKQRITFNQGYPVLADDPVIKGNRRVLSHDGQRIATWIDPSSIELRDVATTELIGRTTRSANISAFTFTPDNHGLVTLDPARHEIGIWQFEMPGSYTLFESSSDVGEIGFSDTGDFLFARGLGVQKSWYLPALGSDTMPRSTEPSAFVVPPVPKKDASDYFAFDADLSSGRHVVIIEGSSTRGGANRTLEVWRDETKLAQLKLAPILDATMSRYLQFAGDGRFVIVGSRQGLMVLHAVTLDKVATLFHQDVVLAGMTTSGLRAVTMASDYSVRIWDITTGLETTRLNMDKPAQALALSNDGRWLSALHGQGESEDGSEISLWALSPSDLIAQACRWLEAPCP